MAGVSERNGNVAPTGTLKRLLEIARDGVFVTTEDNRVVLWNRAAEMMMGYRAAEVIGRACRDVLVAQGRTGTPRCVSGWDVVAPVLTADGLDQTFDVETRTKAGDARWLSVSACAITDDAGRGPFVVHVLRDVTSSKRLHRLLRERLGRGRHATVEPPSSGGALSARELEVLRLLAAGVGTAASAQRLGVSRATVRNHVQNIFGKLGVHSRLEAVALATRRRLL